MSFLKVNKVKIVALTLVAAIMGGVVYNTGAFDKSKANEVTNEEKQVVIDEAYEDADCVSEEELPEVGDEIATYTENGTEYVVTSYEEGDSTYSQVIDEDGETRRDIIFSNNNQDLEVIDYKKVSTDESDEAVYVEVDSQKVDFAKLSAELELEHNEKCHNKSYSGRYHESFKGDIWYEFDEEYFKIGKNANFDVPVNEIYKFNVGNITPEQKAKLEEFIKASEATSPESYKLLASGCAVGTGAVLAATFTGGIGAVIALLGGGIVATKQYNDWKASYEKVVVLYEEIKLFGELELKEEIEIK